MLDGRENCDTGDSKCLTREITDAEDLICLTGEKLVMWDILYA